MSDAVAPSSMRVRSGEVALAVRQYGTTGDVVLLLHGGPGCPDYLEPVARRLGATHRAVTFDQRGVGASGRASSFDLDDYVRDIEAVREHLGADRVQLFGHSWGGLLAQLYLRAHPQRVSGMILANSATGVGEQWVAMQREVMAFNRRRGGLVAFAALGLWSLAARVPGAIGNAAGRRVLERVWRNYFPEPDEAPPADQAWLDGSRSVAARATVAAVVAAPGSLLDGIGEATSAPVLVVYGDDDIYGESAEQVRQRFRGARHVPMEDCGHLPWLRAPDRFFDLVEEFLSATAPRAS
jgi:proline iminopeptidase